MKAMLVEISETVDHLQFNNLKTILLNPLDYRLLINKVKSFKLCLELKNDINISTGIMEYPEEVKDNFEVGTLWGKPVLLNHSVKL
jgi:hypothetical protein